MIREEHGFTAERAWRHSGIPRGDRAAWVTLLLRYPLDRDWEYAHTTEADHAAATAAAQRGDIPNGPDSCSRHAWRLRVEREGDALMSTLDILSVTTYVEYGGSLAEARAYLDAVEHAASPPGIIWAVWARENLGFNASRFEAYRRMGISPDDLRSHVTAGRFTTAYAVQDLARWRNRVCPDAPLAVAATYREYDLTEADVVACEEQRKAGEDVLATLATLVALREP